MPSETGKPLKNPGNGRKSGLPRKRNKQALELSSSNPLKQFGRGFGRQNWEFVSQTVSTARIASNPAENSMALPGR
jgi:hypothetical protein